MGVLGGFGQGIGKLGTALNLPELGISELLGSIGGGQIAGTGSQQSGYSKDGNASSPKPMRDTAPTAPPSGPLVNGTYDPAAAQAAAQRASALAEINRILGTIDTKRDQGLSRLNASYGSAAQRLGEDRQRDLSGYDEQSKQNEADKLRGTEQVDQFANDSYSNLRRLLLGANAGGSAVARELVPQIVSKAAGQRRQGVFDTYAQNEGGIDTARNDAITQYNRSEEDLNNQRKLAEESFRRSIIDQQNELTRQQQELGGIDPGTANAQISSRDAQLNALFNQFSPTFSARAVNLQTPDISKYTVDRAAVQQGGGQYPGETAYYLPALRKKQQGLQ